MLSLFRLVCGRTLAGPPRPAAPFHPALPPFHAARGQGRSRTRTRISLRTLHSARAPSPRYCAGAALAARALAASAAEPPGPRTPPPAGRRGPGGGGHVWTRTGLAEDTPCSGRGRRRVRAARAAAGRARRQADDSIRPRRRVRRHVALVGGVREAGGVQAQGPAACGPVRVRKHAAATAAAAGYPARAPLRPALLFAVSSRRGSAHGHRRGVLPRPLAAACTSCWGAAGASPAARTRSRRADDAP